MALKYKGKKDRQDHPDPEVRAVRLGWTKEPTMPGWHWLARKRPDGIHMTIAQIQQGLGRWWWRDENGTVDTIKTGDLFLKIVTPKPPESARFSGK